MYKKIFEKKFKDSADATNFLDSTGWDYKGKKGIFSKYHLYVGVEIYMNSVTAAYKLRLYPEGHVVLFSDYSLNGVLGTTGLPTRVWESKHIYDHLTSFVSEANEKLRNQHGCQFQIEWAGPKSFLVFQLEREKDGFGFTMGREHVAHFEYPKPAFDWAISNKPTPH